MSDFTPGSQNPLKQVFSATPSCLEPEQLSAYLEAPAPAGSHVASCPHCQAELGMMREFLGASPSKEEALPARWIAAELARRSPVAPAPRPWLFIRWRPDFRMISLAAASFAMIVSATLYMRHSPEPVLPIGYHAQGDAMRSGLVLVSPAGEIDSAPRDLRWKPVAGAQRYQVRLTEVDENQIWSSETPLTQVEIPATVQHELAPGRSFLWQVAALDEQGKKISVSNLQKFHIPITTRVR